ncbi:hypothetical protein [Hymenobacter edaphi]|uniref:hypothetical protein n=1 Tax=Hymenobacter edaphi TaxID=2211146 RepID=UPI0010579D0D|nr:hypothetical protein [Hymenobacter edaphi]
MRTLPAPPRDLSFGLLLNADGSIRDVVLNSPVPEPQATTLKTLLRQGPAQPPYRYKGQPVPTVIPVALDWAKALTISAAAPEQVETVRLTSVVQLGSPAGGVFLQEAALKPLRRRLVKDLAGQALQLELGLNKRGQVELWQALNITDPALAAEVSRRLMAVVRSAGGSGIALQFGKVKYVSRQLYFWPLP